MRIELSYEIVKYKLRLRFSHNHLDV